MQLMHVSFKKIMAYRRTMAGKKRKKYHVKYMKRLIKRVGLFDLPTQFDNIQFKNGKETLSTVSG